MSDTEAFHFLLGGEFELFRTSRILHWRVSSTSQKVKASKNDFRDLYLHWCGSQCILSAPSQLRRMRKWENEKMWIRKSVNQNLRRNSLTDKHINSAPVPLPRPFQTVSMNRPGESSLWHSCLLSGGSLSDWDPPLSTMVYAAFTL